MHKTIRFKPLATVSALHKAVTKKGRETMKDKKTAEKKNVTVLKTEMKDKWCMRQDREWVKTIEEKYNVIISIWIRGPTREIKITGTHPGGVQRADKDILG